MRKPIRKKPESHKKGIFVDVMLEKSDVLMVELSILRAYKDGLIEGIRAMADAMKEVQ